jgi:hypothetical protein
MSTAAALHPWQRIPLDLRERPQWLLAARDSDGWFKVPTGFNIRGQLVHGSSTDRLCWMTWERVAAYA